MKTGLFRRLKRRVGGRLLAVGLGSGLGFGGPAMASDCAAALGAGARTVTTPELSVAWLPEPSPIPRDRHFALRLRVCSPQAWVLTRVDADMPAHRHGMNYRAALQPAGPGLWRAEGLMFHMSGRWRLLLDVQLEGRRLRLTDELDLK
jgi:hypothetical protein